MIHVNTTSEHLKARKVFIFKHLRFDEHLKFHVQLTLARKKLYNLVARNEKVDTRLFGSPTLLKRLMLCVKNQIKIVIINNTVPAFSHISLEMVSLQ